MTEVGGGNNGNTISGGTQQGPVLMGQCFSNITFGTKPAASAPVALAQLPALVAEFAGREAELKQLIELLDPAEDTGAVVVSALAGLAGIGKTALAVHAGHAACQEGWFPGGVLFIDLHGYDEAPVKPGQALDALLRALRVTAQDIPSGDEERAGLYRSALAQISDSVLIIVDNASSETQVRLLLPGPGPHRVLVTSRHTLAGLGARLLDVTVLSDEASVALLDKALRVARPDDDRIGANRPDAGRLAGICGGLPLALQIAAALLKADPSLTVSELADELTDEMQRLEALRYDDGGGTSALSVAAAFELSYRQLDKATARLFRLLPVNPGPDVSTAAVAALADQRISDARKVISQLIRAHLVEPAPGAHGRWRMHDLLRVYAQQLSDAHADRDRREQARDRLLRYYSDKARAANSHLQALPGWAVPADFTSLDSAVAWLDDERPNLVAAITMASRTGRDRAAMWLALRLAAYLEWRRRFDDLLATATIGRDAARRLRERHNEAIALNGLGTALREARRFEEAIAAHQRAVKICQQTGDRYGEGVALNNLGLTLRQARRFKEAIAAHREDFVICQETGNLYGAGAALNNVGIALREIGQLEQAITAHQEAAVIFSGIGDQRYEGTALTGAGLALREAGRLKEAITAHQRAVAIFRRTGDQYDEGMALDHLGIAVRKAGRLEKAITAHQRAVAIFESNGDQHSEGVALSNLGIALREAGRLEEAVTAHQRALAIFRKTGDQQSEEAALKNLELDRTTQQA